MLTRRTFFTWSIYKSTFAKTKMCAKVNGRHVLAVILLIRRRRRQRRLEMARRFSPQFWFRDIFLRMLSHCLGESEDFCLCHFQQKQSKEARGSSDWKVRHVRHKQEQEEERINRAAKNRTITIRYSLLKNKQRHRATIRHS